ncbi:hypothetical protein V491_06387, partial [Pseudogymnoascus sp. VKM F-3775]
LLPLSFEGWSMMSEEDAAALREKEKAEKAT